MEGVSGLSETEIKPDDDPRYPGAEAGRQPGERSEHELGLKELLRRPSSK